MSYRRSGRKRKRPRYFSRGYDRRGIGLYGRAAKRRRMNAPEHKFFDFELSRASLAQQGQAVDTFPTAPLPVAFSNGLVPIPQGVGESERIGRKCTITRINLRLNFEFLVNNQEGSGTTGLAAASTAHETVRLLVYWDKQCNGAAASPGDILQDNRWNGFREMANVHRFIILHDKIYTWNSGAIGGADSTASKSTTIVKDYAIRISKKVWIPIKYNGVTGIISEIKQNNIGFFIWTKHGGRIGLTNISGLKSRGRIRFIG